MPYSPIEAAVNHPPRVAVRRSERLRNARDRIDTYARPDDGVSVPASASSSACPERNCSESSALARLPLILERRQLQGARIHQRRSAARRRLWPCALGHADTTDVEHVASERDIVHWPQWARTAAAGLPRKHRNRLRRGDLVDNGGSATECDSMFGPDSRVSGVCGCARYDAQA